MRDERPAPDPAFAHSLDERAERGFPRAREAPPAFTWPKLTLPALGVAASRPARRGDRHVDPERRRRRRRRVRRQRQRRRRRRRAHGRRLNTERRGRAAEQRAADGARADSAGGAASRRCRPRSPPRRPSTPTAAAAATSSARPQIMLATPPRDIDRAAAKIIAVADDLGGFVVSSQITSRSRAASSSCACPSGACSARSSRLSASARCASARRPRRTSPARSSPSRSRLKDARTERRSPAAPARQGHDDQRDHQHPRAPAPRLQADRGRQARPPQRQAAGELLDDLGHAASPTTDAAARPATTTSWTPGRRPRRRRAASSRSPPACCWSPARVALPLGLVALLVWLAARQAAQRRRERALDAV